MNLTQLHQQHPELKHVTDLLIEAGGRPFLVGGSVRDISIGKPAKDLDIEVFGLEETKLLQTLKQRYKVELVGKQFGVFILKGFPFDIAIPRTETRTGPKHTDFNTQPDPHLSIEKAAARRDFTINAMYVDLSNNKRIDPYNGQRDLQQKILRHTSDQFSEDPLRVYRAMQFIARFNLDCHPNTLALCRSMSGEHLPEERVWGEFQKLILQGVAIRKGLEFLKDTGWLNTFPELEALIGCQQDAQWHPEGDVWNHTLLAMDAFAHRRTGNPTEDLIVGLAVLCHDLGKPETSFEEKGRIRSPQHDKAGVPLTTQFLQRLTREQAILKAVPPLVAEHMAPFCLFKDNAGDAALRRLALRTGRVDRLMRVCQADREGRQDPWEPLPFPEGDWIAQKMEALNLQDQHPKPILQGRDLIRRGLKPGPHFSEILDQLFHQQIEGNFHTREQAINYLKKWLNKHPQE